ncbi:MAG: T9SS type A sorting domain-containing protein [Bacteroidales bacterium]|nr:T9SS type A sorting domain-containing protein [Bacteroidales bacterium]
MKALKTLSILILTLLGVGSAHGQAVDSVDAVDYDVAVDLSSGSWLRGYADVTLRLLRPCATVGLDMACIVDSVRVQGALQGSNSLAALPTAGIATGQDFHVEVWYHSPGYIESGGWGGMHFENSLSYNLGVGFDADPHVMGRALFPCRDNFTDKATYTLRVITKAGWTAECGGVCQSAETDSLGREHSVWRISQPTPTYLVSVSQAAWERIHDTVPSLYGDYPLSIGYRSRTENSVRMAFAKLDSVVPMYERCFGPYRWGRIGYIATPQGSMEHVNNIALDQRFVNSTAERAQTTIAHELGHAWFGNLVTCATAGDMWINEGGASFCSEVAMEAALGREASDDYYRRWLESVLRTTHITDRDYRPLHDMPHQYTYGSTTYDKGWMVWHSLRGYLGEEVFYSAMNRLMARCAFGNIDAEGLRDSLSLYTGVDLTAFFDFHVFGPGFVDYHVEMVNPGEGSQGQEVRVHIRQQGVGTANLMRRNRVPLTFYARPGFDSTSCKRVATFDGEETYAVFSLPFVPAYCVLDADDEFSDAATVIHQSLEGYGVSCTLPLVFMRAKTEHEGNLHVEHHYARPSGEMPGGVVRTADRYWIVRGDWQEDTADWGMFRYIRTGFQHEYANLDRGFLVLTASADSLALMYRQDSEHDWYAVSFTRNGDANSGYLVADELRKGEHTLAIVDREHLGIVRPGFMEVQLFPNPLQPGQVLAVEVESEEAFEVSIFDLGGRQVWHKSGCRSGQKLSPALAKGTYFVRIENNFISLQSKLIQL